MEKKDISTNNNTSKNNIKQTIIKDKLSDSKIVIIDKEKEYENLAKSLGGELIDLKKSKSSIINIFDIN